MKKFIHREKPHPAQNTPAEGQDDVQREVLLKCLADEEAKEPALRKRYTAARCVGASVCISNLPGRANPPGFTTTSRRFEAEIQCLNSLFLRRCFNTH